MYNHADGALLYGIPAGISSERGIKIGFHNRQHLLCEPGNRKKSILECYSTEMSSYVEEIFPGLNPLPISSRSCFYTMSKDQSFLIGTSREHSNVFYASACSGHGFKFGSAIGEVLALLAQGKSPPIDISNFNLSRFKLVGS